MKQDFKFNMQLFADEATGNAAAATPPAGTATGSEAAAPAAGTDTTTGAGLLSDDGQTATGDKAPAGDGLLAGGEKAPEGGENKPAEESQGAPEAYTDFTVPETVAPYVNLDAEAMTSFKDLAKGLNLPQESAQKLVDYQSQLMDTQQKQLIAAHEQQAQAWKAEAVKTYSQQEIGDAVRGFKSAPEGMRQILTEYKLDNHPAFVGFFRDLGKGLKEDNFETGKQTQNTDKSAAEVLYPDLVKK